MPDYVVQTHGVLLSLHKLQNTHCAWNDWNVLYSLWTFTTAYNIQVHAKRETSHTMHIWPLTKKMYLVEIMHMFNCTRMLCVHMPSCYQFQIHGGRVWFAWSHWESSRGDISIPNSQRSSNCHQFRDKGKVKVAMSTTLSDWEVSFHAIRADLQDTQIEVPQLTEMTTVNQAKAFLDYSLIQKA